MNKTCETCAYWFRDEPDSKYGICWLVADIDENADMTEKESNTCRCWVLRGNAE